MDIDIEKLKLEWQESLQPLVGRIIVGIRYMTPDECKIHHWSRSALVIMLDDGTAFWPSMDDEGNEAGALFIAPSTKAKKEGLVDVAPVI